MIARYNPHKFQKQARAWKSIQSNDQSLLNDILQRQLSIWNTEAFEWQMPTYCSDIIISSDIYEEYGHDACRMATIMSIYNKQTVESLLETCHKWISKFHISILSNESKPFNPAIWLKACYMAKDYIKKQNRYDLAIAALKKAIKLSPPCNSLKLEDKTLILGCLYPFFPIISGYFLLDAYHQWPTDLNFKSFLNEKYQNFKPIKFAINKSGWYWEIFETISFIQNPKLSFATIPWLAKATNNKDFEIQKEQEGYRLCLKM